LDGRHRQERVATGLAATRITKRGGKVAKASKIVALFGDSLFIDSIEASLQASCDLGLVRIHESVGNALERLKLLAPDLVIIDSLGPTLQLMMPFLRDRPDIPLLCLDVDCSRVIVMSGQHHMAKSASDLAHLIQLQTAPQEVAWAA
jgi:hypothetical protein